MSSTASQKQKKQIPPIKNYGDPFFQQRLEKIYEELYTSYSAIYHTDEMFEKLLDSTFQSYSQRSESLKKLDSERLQDPFWYCKSDSIAIHLYADKFAGTLRGIESKLDYLQELGIKFVYVLPFLRSPPEKSDGGYACSDFRNVQEVLGSINDLEHLINCLHERGMCFAMDFVVNHTSDMHEWAIRAKNGETEYQSRYYFFDSWYLPNQFDSCGVMGHFFGDMAPDNFTFVPECKKIVMTTFYPYQWDLNFTNPIVFNETVSNILFLMNKGVDVMFFNSAPYLWKKIGTNCRNLPQSYVINNMIDTLIKLASPSSVACFDLKIKEKLAFDPSSSFVEDLPETTIDDDNFDSDIDYTIEFDDQNDDNMSEINQIDTSKPIGQLHQYNGWMSQLWASLAMGDVYAIECAIHTICKTFHGLAYFTRVHSHDDINWGFGFDVDSNSHIGNGKDSRNSYRRGIITLYRYLNDFYAGAMPGSFAKGIIFGEDLVTGKARICGTTASLLGLERALEEEKRLNQKKSKSRRKTSQFSEDSLDAPPSTNSAVPARHIDETINRILLLQAVSASMPSLYIIYSGDEIGELNDYSYKSDQNIVHDTRYLQRGTFDWESAANIESDPSSYQSRIYHGIQKINKTRIACPYFTECYDTKFLYSYIPKTENESEKIDSAILMYKRIRKSGKYLLFIFNFCGYQRPVKMGKEESKVTFRNLVTGEQIGPIDEMKIKGYGWLWLEPV